MRPPGIRLRHLTFHGPSKEPASVSFGPGLNVICGASNTGKSFIVHAIDFMLGGTTPLPDIPERVGYDRVLLGLETLDQQQFTLQRSAEGGSFWLYDGLQDDTPKDMSTARALADHHSERDPANASSFLLGLCGLAGKKVRKKKGAIKNLTFRVGIPHLIIVDEKRMIETRSPLLDGNYPNDPPNFATFKLLLTGVDDSALQISKGRGPEMQSREAQLELLGQLIEEYDDDLSEFTNDPADLPDQLERIESSIAHHAEQLGTTEHSFRELAVRRRELRKRLEDAEQRAAEVGSLVERFDLLDRHYLSDLARLRGIEEAGSIFEVLGRGPCPLCGADPANHSANEECDANIDAVIAAARSEIHKIELLQGELTEARRALVREAASFAKRLPRIESDLFEVSRNVEQLSLPIATLRKSYAAMTDERSRVSQAIAIAEKIHSLEQRRRELEKDGDTTVTSTVSDGDLPSMVAEEFAQGVENILQRWNFPGAQRVYFDAKSKDLLIAGKKRSAYGKGLRAITHAAFTVGILDHCRRKGTPHPGFVVLDSPLMAYRAPEGSEDDLRGSDLQDQFYSYLSTLPDDRQVLVVENVDPPVSIRVLPQTTFFSANPHADRYGFFPARSTDEDSMS